MANSYYSSMYRRYAPSYGECALKGEDKYKFRDEWMAAVQKLKDSGYDLSKIQLVMKG